jgi:hypothetical protein
MSLTIAVGRRGGRAGAATLMIRIVVRTCYWPAKTGPPYGVLFAILFGPMLPRPTSPTIFIARTYRLFLMSSRHKNIPIMKIIKHTSNNIENDCSNPQFSGHNL